MTDTGIQPVGTLTLGVDIGQRVDRTAIALAEAQPRAGANGDEVHFVVRHLERLPLGTPYPEVTRRIETIVAIIRARVGERGLAASGLRLYLDATGVGQPVVDLLTATGVRCTPVYFTHGDRRTDENGEVKLGKAYLVSRLKTLAQTDRLHLPETAESEAVRREFLDYELRVDEQANDKYGAFRTGAHDDLVTALGLAVQTDPVAGWEVITDPEVIRFLREAGIGGTF